MEGEGAINNIKARTSRGTIVRVDDENHKPVAGAAVVFVLPDTGPGGTFSGGAKTVTVLSDRSGRAIMPRLQPNQVTGNFQVHVTASANGQQATTTVSQSNAAGSAASSSSSAAHGGLSGKTIGILVGVVAAGGIGAAAGLKGKSPPSSPSSPSPSGTIAAAGTPVFGPHP